MGVGVVGASVVVGFEVIEEEGVTVGKGLVIVGLGVMVCVGVVVRQALAVGVNVDKLGLGDTVVEKMGVVVGGGKIKVMLAAEGPVHAIPALYIVML